MKQVIVLETNPGTPGLIRVRAAMWFPVTAGQEAPVSGLASSAYHGATSDEILALSSGAIAEEVFDVPFGKSVTNADIQKQLKTIYTDRLAARNAQPAQGGFYGVYLDSVTGNWVQGAK